MFQAAPGDVDDRACTACGRNPSLGIESPPSVLAFAPRADASVPDSAGGIWDAGKASFRKRKPNYFMVKLFSAWLAVILIIIFVAKSLYSDAPEKTAPFVSKAPPKYVIPDEDIRLAEKASPLCTAAFSNFLSAATPEKRSQYVLNSVTSVARMTRFYSMNPLVNIDPRKLSITTRAVIHLPAGPAIETQWTTADGHSLDAVFVKENDEWRLDWDHYARFGDYPWTLFLAGSGESQGEFRLLARERLADERKNAETISIVLYAPRFGDSKNPGYVSPEFLVKRDSKNGRLLGAAFKLEKSGTRVFGVKLPSIDPEGFIRIRAKIRRTDKDSERHFELEEVIACHWYASDVPGVEIPAQPAIK